MTYDEYIINSKELRHFGVLGMRWGIRRYQPYPPGQHGKFLGQTRDEDIRIKKGTTSYRIQNTAKISDRAGQMYASITPKDNITYVGAVYDGAGNVATDINFENGNNGNPYVVKMKFTEDIVAPSYKESMEAFCETFGNIKLNNVRKNLSANSQDTKRAKMIVKELSKMGIKDARDQSYLLFMSDMMNDSKARTAFINNLKKKGYNAIIDDWDTRWGKNSYTDAPIIVFDRKKSVKQASSLALTNKIMEVITAGSYGGIPDNPIAKKTASEVYKDLDKFYDDDSWKQHPYFRDAFKS